jgi:streptogramin lyase
MIAGRIPAVLAAVAAIVATPGTEVVAKLDLGGEPCGVVGAAGSVWVSDAAAARLLRIDPATNAVAGSIPVDRTPCELHTALGSIWVVTRSQGSRSATAR